MYKGNSCFGGTKLTDRVCDLIGWEYQNAIKTMRRGKVVYIRATLLKPDEVSSFKKLNGKQIDGCVCRTMNFN